MTLALSLAYALPDPHLPADVEPEHDARQLCLVWNRDIGMDEQQEAPPFRDWRVEGVWRTHNHPARFWEAYIVAPDADGEVNVARAQGASKKEASAIAGRVVHAMRCHDDLLAALEQVLETNERADCDLASCRDQRCLALRAARAAIAKARKGALT